MRIISKVIVAKDDDSINSQIATLEQDGWEAKRISLTGHSGYGTVIAVLMQKRVKGKEKNPK